MAASTAAERIAAFEQPEYLMYEELTQLVQAFAEVYPELATCRSIGRSPEGREIWLLTITGNGGAGADKKPAILIEGNIHAGEVTASSAALYTVKRLLAGYGKSKAITHLLDRSTVYVVPRLAVDGAEFHLRTPYMLRSTPRPYPDEVGPTEGLMPEDLDGDGRVRLMRKADPLGEWKISTLDPRIMVRRQPDDWEGPFYRLYNEGVLLQPEGRPVQNLKAVRPNRGLDFNRNFPAHWSPEAKQPGAGRYPLDQPETRALAEFMLSHPNLSIYLALHTSGGVLLRPPSLGPDDALAPSDLRLYEALGQLCQRTTGYPCRSSYHAFYHTPGQPMTKGSKDWAYEHLGLIAYTMELWDLNSHAGANSYGQLGARGMLRLEEWERESDELKRLQWNDRELNGEGFKRWTRFAHPQLGEVEIGGWDEKWVRQNCPPRFLAEECRKVSEFVTKLALALPHLAIRQTRVTRLAGSAWRVEAEVTNDGFLGTVTTRTAGDQRLVKPVQARLNLGERAVLLAGGQEQELGQLEGYSAVQDVLFGGATNSANSTAWAEWVVDAPAGAEVTVTVTSTRAGEVSQVIVLVARDAG